MRAEFYDEVRCKRLLLRVSAPSLPFRWVANPYRGCQHPCAYCYAQGVHQYRGPSGGQDMERRVVVKVNAAEVLRRELLHPAWSRELLAIGAACDPYQPAELTYKVTQRMLSALVEVGQPCYLNTKSTLILRDLELLKTLASRVPVQVGFPLCTLKEDVWRHVEPESSRPEKRLEALERLAQAGVPAGVILAPILPDLTDGPRDLEELVRAAADRGAQFLSANVPFLKPGSREWTLPLLREQYPHLTPQYVRYYRGVFAPASYSERVTAYVAELRQKYRLPEQPTTAVQAPLAGQLRLGI